MCSSDLLGEICRLRVRDDAPEPTGMYLWRVLGGVLPLSAGATDRRTKVVWSSLTASRGYLSPIPCMPIPTKLHALMAVFANLQPVQENGLALNDHEILESFIIILQTQ